MADDGPGAAVRPPGDEADSVLITKAIQARWQGPPSDALSARRLEKRRVPEAMRTIIEQLVSTDAPTDIIADAADELERVVASFKELSGRRDYIGFAEAANAGGDRFASFEHSP